MLKIDFSDEEHPFVAIFVTKLQDSLPCIMCSIVRIIRVAIGHSAASHNTLPCNLNNN